MGGGGFGEAVPHWHAEMTLCSAPSKKGNGKFPDCSSHPRSEGCSTRQMSINEISGLVMKREGCGQSHSMGETFFCFSTASERCKPAVREGATRDSSIQVTAHIYGHLLPSANMWWIDSLNAKKSAKIRNRRATTRTPAGGRFAASYRKEW